MVDTRRFNNRGRRFYKSNFVDFIDIVLPDVYKEEDITLSGKGLSPKSEIINGHISLANNAGTYFSISSISNDPKTKDLDNISGLSKYFVKQNNLTKISPFELETKILQPLNNTLANYATSAEFSEYLSSNLLPKIIPPTTSTVGTIENNMSELSALTNDEAPSSVHSYLTNSLGWFYFLNTSALGGLDYSPSAYVLESLLDVFAGDTLVTVDGVQGLTEYLWKNSEVCSFGQFIPNAFLSGAADAIVDASAGKVATYTSGTQKLDALKTMVDVVYSPLYIDSQDYSVKDAFEDFIDTQNIIVELEPKGPHRKFTSLLGYGLADISNKVETISLLYDVESCPEEYLEKIAELIGYRLRGKSTDKWRNQLRIAVDLYKKSGTLDAIQSALDSIVVDSVLDVSGKAYPLWESYIPFLIWYALGTESPLFKDLTTWTPEKAVMAGVNSYSFSSIEENMKMVTDSILIDLYSEFPENFSYNGELFPVPRFVTLDENGQEQELYTLVGDPKMKPFHVHTPDDPVYQGLRKDADINGELLAFDESFGMGPLGEGVYMAGESHPEPGVRPTYLKFKGSLEFFFNYRGKINFPLPPFEEVKYYEECSITSPLISLLVDRLKCFQVRTSFADTIGTYISEASVDSSASLDNLNGWLMFFQEAQNPPNFAEVIESISEYDKNILSLYNGKSSHIFIDFDSDDFDFTNTSFEAEGKYALYEAARVAREYAPGHAITTVNLNASATDSFPTPTGSKFLYLGLDEDDNRNYYTSASVLSNFENSGVAIVFSEGGGDDNRSSTGGRGGLNTFKRKDVSSLNTYLSGTTVVDVATVPRRAIRRRNYKYLLPKEGYYDRAGFNGPQSFDASVLENSMASSLGELALGYVASAGKFHPVIDPISPSGVWDICENLNSSRTFSGVDTSNTFPYRGLYTLTEREDRYVDRGQVPNIYITMHDLLQDKALKLAQENISSASSLYAGDDYWKNNVLSYANSAIASGLLLNSFDEYENFSFGTGLHKLFADYKKYFPIDVSPATLEETGPNIFAHVFASGLYNCDFSIEGSLGDEMIASSLRSASAINTESLWKSGATGTLEVTATDQAVIPLSGTFVEGAANNLEFRNPEVLSGIEFCDISGAPDGNEFTVFRLDKSFAKPKRPNYLINNTIIKCKSLGGLPRIRFDLSAYGPRRNYFIKEHKFKLDVRSLIGTESSPSLGGAELGVWIHTQPTNGLFWTWTSEGRWEPMKTSELSIQKVLDICHRKTFSLSFPATEDKEYCLNNLLEKQEENLNINNIKKEYFEDFTVEFDTRNISKNNNYEYLDVVPVPEEFYRNRPQVHTDDTNYVVEVFLIPNNDKTKYLLIEEIKLEDLTQSDRAGIPTGYGTETRNTALVQFVKEDKLVLTKNQLLDVVKFYNALTAQAEPVYTTSLASRDASITSGIMELSGGSRLSYRMHPDWVPNTLGASGNYTAVEFDN